MVLTKLSLLYLIRLGKLSVPEKEEKELVKLSMDKTIKLSKCFYRKVLELVYKSSLFRFIDFFHSMGFQVLEAIVVEVNEVKYIYK